MDSQWVYLWVLIKQTARIITFISAVITCVYLKDYGMSVILLLISIMIGQGIDHEDAKQCTRIFKRTK